LSASSRELYRRENKLQKGENFFQL
jgi:hypothetical protein